MIVDYLHKRKFPILGPIASWTLRTATVGVLVGVYQFNTNDIGAINIPCHLSLSDLDSYRVDGADCEGLDSVRLYAGYIERNRELSVIVLSVLSNRDANSTCTSPAVFHSSHYPYFCPNLKTTSAEEAQWHFYGLGFVGFQLPYCHVGQNTFPKDLFSWIKNQV
jgi:hypothetical protein